MDWVDLAILWRYCFDALRGVDPVANDSDEPRQQIPGVAGTRLRPVRGRPAHRRARPDRRPPQHFDGLVSRASRDSEGRGGDPAKCAAVEHSRSVAGRRGLERRPPIAGAVPGVHMRHPRACARKPPFRCAHRRLSMSLGGLRLHHVHSSGRGGPELAVVTGATPRPQVPGSGAGPCAFFARSPPPPAGVAPLEIILAGRLV